MLWADWNHSCAVIASVVPFVKARMSNENYLNHPTFGLLFRVCLLDEGQELYATLYAHRLFFVVTNDASGLAFDPIGRVEAKQMIDQRLRVIRRTGEQAEYDQLQRTYKQAF